MPAMTPRERLKVGSAHKEFAAKPFMLGQQPKALPIEAKPKPWDDKDSPPYPGNDDSDGGHYDGDISEPFNKPPGEDIKVPPSQSPSSDTLNLRASLEAAAEASRDPDVQRAMRAIEARLAEISLFMQTATRGASKDMAIKLGVLAHIL